MFVSVCVPVLVHVYTHAELSRQQRKQVTFRDLEEGRGRDCKKTGMRGTVGDPSTSRDFRRKTGQCPIIRKSGKELDNKIH